MGKIWRLGLKNPNPFNLVRKRTNQQHQIAEAIIEGMFLPFEFVESRNPGVVPIMLTNPFFHLQTLIITTLSQAHKPLLKNQNQNPLLKRCNLWKWGLTATTDILWIQTLLSELVVPFHYSYSVSLTIKVLFL